MMAGSIDVAGAVSDYNNDTQDSADQIVAARAQQTDLANQSADATEQIGKNAAIVSSTEGTGNLAAQTRTANYQSQLAPEDKIAGLAQDFWTNYQAAQQMSDQILQKRQSSIFDNPLQAISDQFTVGHDIAVHNVLADKANTAMDASNSIAQSVYSNAAANKASAIVLTAQSVAAKAEELSLQAKVSADTLRSTGIGYNIAGMQELQQANQSQLNALIQQHQMANADASLAMQAQSVAISRQDAAQRAEIYNRQIAADNLEKAGQDEYIKNINTGLSAMGRPPVNFATVKQVIANDPNGKVNFTNLYQAGAVANAGGPLQISTDPSKSAIFLAANRGSLPASAGKVQDLLTSSVSAAADALKSNTMLKPEQKTLTLDNLTASLGNAIPDTAAAMMKDRSSNPAKNIYTAPSLDAIVQQVPAVKESPLYTSALAPLIAMGQTSSDPSQVVAAGLAAVKSKTLSVADLNAGIIQLYGAANAANSATQGYKLAGLPDPVGYKSKVPTGSNNPFSSKASVDFTDPVQVSRFTSTRLVNQALEGTAGMFQGSFVNP